MWFLQPLCLVLCDRGGLAVHRYFIHTHDLTLPLLPKYSSPMSNGGMSSTSYLKLVTRPRAITVGPTDLLNPIPASFPACRVCPWRLSYFLPAPPPKVPERSWSVQPFFLCFILCHTPEHPPASYCWGISVWSGCRSLLFSQWHLMHLKDMDHVCISFL